MNVDILARTVLMIWNKSYLNDVQNLEFKSKDDRDRIQENLKPFKCLKVSADWYDLGFFKFNPVYTLRVERI